MNITLALDETAAKSNKHIRKNPTTSNLQNQEVKTCRKKASSKAWTCAEISRPETRDAQVSRKASATTEFSLPKHLQSPRDI